MGIISLNDIAQRTLNGQCKGDQSVMDVEKLVTQKYKQVSSCTHWLFSRHVVLIVVIDNIEFHQYCMYAVCMVNIT